MKTYIHTNFNKNVQFRSVQFSSVAQSCLTLCNPMNCSTPGLPIHHQLPEFTETHVHWVGDVIQPSHPLSSLSRPAPNPSQHQSLFLRIWQMASLADPWQMCWTGWLIQGTGKAGNWVYLMLARTLLRLGITAKLWDPWLLATDGDGCFHVLLMRS